MMGISLMARVPSLQEEAEGFVLGRDGVYGSLVRRKYLRDVVFGKFLP